jgi:hypothetical protein
MINLPKDLPRHYRYEYRVTFTHGTWRHDYIAVGAKGGVNLHVSGPHTFDGGDHWSAGIELHSRTPFHDRNRAPDHDQCWVLHAPCWSDGTSTYAQKYFLPMVMEGDHERIFRQMVRWADDQFEEPPK